MIKYKTDFCLKRFISTLAIGFAGSGESHYNGVKAVKKLHELTFKNLEFRMHSKELISTDCELPQQTLWLKL